MTILMKRLGKHKGVYVQVFPDVLWSYQITPRVLTGQTVFSLVFEVEAILSYDVRFGLKSNYVRFRPRHNQ